MTDKQLSGEDTHELESGEFLQEHANKYKTDAWREYTPQELANWVINLGKRATHRTDPKKAKKDLRDAENYLLMLQSWLNEQSDKAIKGPEQEW